MPRLFILSGCNGSGKTTASYALLPELLDCREFVNSDEFAKYLSPFNPASASISASRFMLTKVRYLMSRRQDFSIETTLATRVLVQIIQQAKEFGYTVILLYFWLRSPELAISRVRDRVLNGGHDIPDDVVRRRYHTGLRYFFEIYVPLADKWMLADNSQSPFRIIAEGDKKDIFIKDEDKYRYIQEQLSEQV
ncbi:MAG: zeta toxin family protein [Bacteroidales bacterium]|nr:zeta toxin family protein [Bacteroidales bacterium]